MIVFTKNPNLKMNKNKIISGGLGVRRGTEGGEGV